MTWADFYDLQHGSSPRFWDRFVYTQCEIWVVDHVSEGFWWRRSLSDDQIVLKPLPSIHGPIPKREGPRIPERFYASAWGKAIEIVLFRGFLYGVAEGTSL
jgi:hypothetical protein